MTPLRALKSWNACIDDWWTAPEANAAGRIGLFRILYCTFYLWHLSQSSAAILSGFPAAHRSRVLLLELSLLSTDLPPIFFVALEAILVASLVALMVGYRVRVMTGAVLVLGCVLEALHTSMDHEHATSFIAFYIPFFMLLAGARWGHTYSIDAVLGERAGREVALPTNSDWRYFLPTRALLVVLSALFLSAAIYKVIPSSTWLDRPGFLIDLMLEKNVQSAILDLPLNPLAPVVSEWPLVGSALRWGIILFEALFVLAILNRGIRSVILAQALLFHAVNALWLAVTFSPILIVYGSFVDWQSLRRLLHPRPITWLDAIPSPLLVAACVGLSLAAGYGWNSGDGLRAALNIGSLLDWRTVWYPVVPLALIWWVTSLMDLVRSVARVAATRS